MKPFTKLASLVLAIIALLHALRVFIKNEVMVDAVSIPIWVSVVGFIIAAVLSIGLWSESK